MFLQPRSQLDQWGEISSLQAERCDGSIEGSDEREEEVESPIEQPYLGMAPQGDGAVVRVGGGGEEGEEGPAHHCESKQ
eukprot:scaffold25297_cov40-Tisochrysis_lutea.AAC.1